MKGMGRSRVPFPPTKVHRDKSKYSRRTRRGHRACDKDAVNYLKGEVKGEE